MFYEKDRLATDGMSDLEYDRTLILLQSGKSDKELASDIYWSSDLLKIVTLSEICWVTNHPSQVRQYRLGRFVLEVVNKECIVLNGCLKSRPGRVHLFEIKNTHDGKPVYTKVLGQSCGVIRKKQKKMVIGYLIHLFQKLRKAYEADSFTFNNPD